MRFTLNVPVRLSNITSDVNRYSVRCIIQDARRATIGSATSPVTNFQRSVNRTVSVRITADAGKNPADGTSYWCFVNLFGTQTINGNGSFSASYNRHFDPDLTRATASVRGNL